MQIIVTKDDQRYGPYSIEQLRGFIDTGNFVHTDMACSDGQNWVQISQLLGTNTITRKNVVRSTSQKSPTSTNPTANAGAVSASVISMLARTQGWVRFFSVLGFICIGLMLIGGIGSFITIIIASNSPVAAILLAMTYILMAAFYFFPTLKLAQYASRIATLRHTQSEHDLVAALDAQRSFWTFIGIVTAIVLGLYLMGFVIVLLGVATMAF